MLLRRLCSSRHLRHGLRTVTPGAATAAPSPYSRLPFRGLLPSRVLSPRLLSTSGRDDDTNKPWNIASDSGDPDPLGSAAATDDPWARGFRAEDGHVFEEIYKEAASAHPARGEAVPAGDEEQWTLSGDEDKDPFAAAVLGEGSEGEGVVLEEFDTGEDAEAGGARCARGARCKSFAWLMLQNRIWTAARLQNRANLE